MQTIFVCQRNRMPVQPKAMCLGPLFKQLIGCSHTTFPRSKDVFQPSTGYVLHTWRGGKTVLLLYVVRYELCKCLHNSIMPNNVRHQISTWSQHSKGKTFSAAQLSLWLLLMWQGKCLPQSWGRFQAALWAEPTLPCLFNFTSQAQTLPWHFLSTLLLK